MKCPCRAPYTIVGTFDVSIDCIALCNVHHCRLHDLIYTLIEDHVPADSHTRLLERAGKDLCAELGIEIDKLDTRLFPKRDAVRGVLGRAIQQQRCDKVR